MYIGFVILIFILLFVALAVVISWLSIRTLGGNQGKSHDGR